MTTARTGTYTARRPTGVTPWPLLLVAGVEKTGVRYAAAQASGSGRFARTFWITVGADLPDPYAAVPGADFEIVEHDGTFTGLLGAVQWASAQPAERPNLLVFTSATALWAMCHEQAQATAHERHDASGATVGPKGVDTTPDLWATANTRHNRVISALRAHPGPVVVTAVLDPGEVVDADGNPTPERRWRPVTQKRLPDAATAIVHLRGYRRGYLVGANAPALAPETGDPGALPDDHIVEAVLDMLAGTGPRAHASYVAAGAAAERAAAVRAVADAAAAAGVPPQQVSEEWAAAHDGEYIGNATDLAGLAALCDDLRTRPTPDPA
ncbi:hypothetical protein [Nocardioides sp. Leaf374]|uniref:hypothetical protein n=1 Tax=Nocardioides sp. Leaf374 TaxID=2876560 RepID=UPI001E384266|nr:hypothetical protein [Nocardioides sp. Leaf374]